MFLVWILKSEGFGTCKEIFLFVSLYMHYSHNKELLKCTIKIVLKNFKWINTQIHKESAMEVSSIYQLSNSDVRHCVVQILCRVKQNSLKCFLQCDLIRASNLKYHYSHPKRLRNVLGFKTVNLENCQMVLVDSIKPTLIVWFSIIRCYDIVNDNDNDDIDRY